MTHKSRGRHENFAGLSRTILRYAGRGLARVDFLRGISKMLLEATRCDALELRVRASDVAYRWEAAERPRRFFRFTPIANSAEPTGSAPYRSRLAIRFAIDGEARGEIELRSLRTDRFTPARVQALKRLSQVLGASLAARRAQWALRERVKELTCLYGIARVAQRPGIPLEETLHGMVELLPPAWQFSGIACARITLDGREYPAPGFRDGLHRQSADIVVNGKTRGAVEVVYTRHRTGFALGAFLKEEQSLIDTVAREVALLIERREAEEYKSTLEEQLRHAGRLATIGQLAAGVAHELNEPLGGILGFAQLVAKDSRLSRRSAQDVDRIVKASLHAREVIQKLLIFAREMPPSKNAVDLNQVVRDGLYFFGPRCAKAGIELRYALASDLTPVAADAAQLRQVLINLVVNAVQAMPAGGILTIATRADRDAVLLAVEDTGTGMTPEVRQRIFTPFFTTKDVSQGTGLGLAVVHGIVTSHGGSIHVESEPGRGARFEIRLPVAKAAAHA